MEGIIMIMLHHKHEDAGVHKLVKMYIVVYNV